MGYMFMKFALHFDCLRLATLAPEAAVTRGRAILASKRPLAGPGNGPSVKARLHISRLHSALKGNGLAKYAFNIRDPPRLFPTSAFLSFVFLGAGTSCFPRIFRAGIRYVSV